MRFILRDHWYYRLLAALAAVTFVACGVVAIYYLEVGNDYQIRASEWPSAADFKEACQLTPEDPSCTPDTDFIWHLTWSLLVVGAASITAVACLIWMKMERIAARRKWSKAREHCVLYYAVTLLAVPAGMLITFGVGALIALM